MRRVFLLLFLTFATGGAWADDENPFAPPSTNNGAGTQRPPYPNGYPAAMGFDGINIGTAHSVLRFTGSSLEMASSVFTVLDKWQVFWASPARVRLTLLNRDGSIVAGLQASGHGSLYVAKGGTYYLQVNSTMPVPWFFIAADGVGGVEAAASGDSAAAAAPVYRDYTPPATILPPGSADASSGVAQNSPPAEPGSVFGGLPPPATNAAAPAAPAPIVALTGDQARAVVLIKGDTAEGTGFLIKTPDGPAVVTNIHVIANNPNLKITTSTGAFVKVVSMKAASDRDLAMVFIEDAGYNYLEVSQDISKNVQPGDEVITPGNSQGGEVMLNTSGHVLGIGPERIEFDNPIYHGNSGGPVFHTKSGKVLGVVTEAMKVDTTDELDKASFASRNSAISSSMRYFGLRLDTVTAWIPIDSRRFQIETAFLDQFHELSRRLDALLNQPSAQNNSEGNSASSDAAKIYLNDEKIMKALHNYSDHAADADANGLTEAKRGLLFDLQSVADQNVMQIQNAANFYSFDQERARDELAYRKALKDEIDDYSSNVERMPKSY